MGDRGVGLTFLLGVKRQEQVKTGAKRAPKAQFRKVTERGGVSGKTRRKEEEQPPGTRGKGVVALGERSKSSGFTMVLHGNFRMLSKENAQSSLAEKGAVI